MSEVATYECKKQCHIPVVINEDGHISNKMFQPQNQDGTIHKSQVEYHVPTGELVPHHFRPINDIAKGDREDQITNPEKYIETAYDMGCIAEFMVDAGFYDDEVVYNEQRGQYVTRKSAKKIAQESIKDTIGDQVYRALISGEANAKELKSREDAITELCKLGKDDKETRKALLKMLKDADITKGFFRGAPVEKLAGFVVDKGLYEE